MSKLYYSAVALLPLLAGCAKDEQVLAPVKQPADIELRLTQVGATPYVNTASFTYLYLNRYSDAQNPKKDTASVYWKGAFTPGTRTYKAKVAGTSGYLNVFYTRGHNANYRTAPGDYIEAELLVNGQVRFRSRIDAATFATTPCYYTDSNGAHLFASIPVYF